MALVRVYCGISSAAEAGQFGTLRRLTVAVVDDSGRLLEYCEIDDDPAGYASLTAFLAERFGGSTLITVAVDSDEHLVVSLLAASGRLIAFTDDDTADDFAERFADDDSLEEVNAADAERRAVGLARALQAGAISASVVNAPREFTALKPVLAAHAALSVGRQAAAVALREVLRELYPAALRAYPDPAAPVALAMLDALPEPGLLTAAAGRGRDAAVNVAARLVSEGVCDNDTALEAVTALRVAITETPRRNGVGKQLNAAVADAVQASVAAVRSADAATHVLVRALTDRVQPATDIPVAAPRRRSAPTPIATVVPRPRPVAPPPVAPAPVSAAPVSPAPLSPAPLSPVPPSPAPMPVAAAAPVVPPMPAPAPAPIVPAAAEQPHAPMPVAASNRPAWSQGTPPPTPPGFEPTPVAGTPLVSRPAPGVPMQRPAPKEPLTPFVPTLTNAAIHSQKATRGLTPPPAPASAPPAPASAPPAAQPAIADPLPSRSDWPLVTPLDDEQEAPADRKSVV